MAICSILYGAFFVPKTAWHPITARMFTKLGILVRLGLAGVGQVGSEWWSWELIGLAASLLGPVALASQSVLLVSASTTFQAPFALSMAAAVRIGNLLGESNAKRAEIATKTSLFMALVIALVWSTMFLVFRKSWARIFNDDPEVIKLVGGVLPLVALFQVFDGLSAVVSGVLRSQGRQTTGALLNISAYYIIGIPSGIYLAFKAGLGLSGLWFGLTISLVYSAFVGGYLCLKADWNYEVTKVLERIAADKHQDQTGGNPEV
jgi:MATE family multidrug resistance protein